MPIIRSIILSNGAELLLIEGDNSLSIAHRDSSSVDTFICEIAPHQVTTYDNANGATLELVEGLRSEESDTKQPEGYEIWLRIGRQELSDPILYAFRTGQELAAFVAGLDALDPIDGEQGHQRYGTREEAMRGACRSCNRALGRRHDLNCEKSSAIGPNNPRPKRVTLADCIEEDGD